MIAVVKTGGKQYKVTVGDVIKVEKINANKGDIINLTEVLMTSENGDFNIGSPFLSNVAVQAEVLEYCRADKIIVFKKKRRQNYRRKAGHKQILTRLKIIAIAQA